MQDMSYPTAAANAKVTYRSPAANSPEYSVPLTAAVTYTCHKVYPKLYELVIRFQPVSCMVIAKSNQWHPRPTNDALLNL